MTAHNLLNNKSSSIRFDHLELLCRLLVCEPSDLFIWRPNKQDAIPSNHQLYKLREEAINITIQQTLSTLPYRTLKEVTKRMLSDEYLNGDDLDSTKNKDSGFLWYIASFIDSDDLKIRHHRTKENLFILFTKFNFIKHPYKTKYLMTNDYTKDNEFKTAHKLLSSKPILNNEFKLKTYN